MKNLVRFLLCGALVLGVGASSFAGVQVSVSEDKIRAELTEFDADGLYDALKVKKKQGLAADTWNYSTSDNSIKLYVSVSSKNVKKGYLEIDRKSKALTVKCQVDSDSAMCGVTLKNQKDCSDFYEKIDVTESKGRSDNIKSLLFPANFSLPGDIGAETSFIKIVATKQTLSGNPTPYSCYFLVNSRKE